MPDFQSLVIATTVIAVGSTEVARIKQSKAPTMRPVIAGFVLGLFLFGIGMISEDIATLFCYLIMVSSILVNGMALFSFVNFSQKG